MLIKPLKVFGKHGQSKSKRGQLHIIETLVAIAIILGLTVTLYQIELQPSEENPVEELQEKGLESLSAADNAGILRPAVYTTTDENLETLKVFLDQSLPPTVLYTLSVQPANDTGEPTLLIQKGEPPTRSDVAVATYLLYGYNNVYNPQIVSLTLWYLS